ncbi:hypothetical protein Hanom_Chr09g00774281 [Helianthus anomalus]
MKKFSYLKFYYSFFFFVQPCQILSSLHFGSISCLSTTHQKFIISHFACNLFFFQRFNIATSSHQTSTTHVILGRLELISLLKTYNICNYMEVQTKEPNYYFPTCTHKTKENTTSHTSLHAKQK